MNKEIGFVGLGRMGSKMTSRLWMKSYHVVSYDKSKETRRKQKNSHPSLKIVNSLKSLAKELSSSRKIWLMIPNDSVDDVLNELIPYLNRGDLVIDGGNSYFVDSKRRYELLKKKDIDFLDVGTSGGLEGVLRGSVFMVGGDRSVFDKIEYLFRDLTEPHRYLFVGKSGSGHFVKGVHNAIEYGMMQAIAEGFGLLSQEDYDVKKIAQLLSDGSIIESRLLSELLRGLGKGYDDIKGVVGGGETGRWILNFAKNLDVEMPALEVALRVRELSRIEQSESSRLLSVIRKKFGGHDEGD